MIFKTSGLLLSILVTCCAAQSSPRDQFKRLLDGLSDRETKIVNHLIGQIMEHQLHKVPNPSKLDNSDLKQLRLGSQGDVPLEAIKSVLERFDIPFKQLRNFTMARKSFMKVLYNPCASIHRQIGTAAHEYESTGDEELLYGLIYDRLCSSVLESIDSNSTSMDNMFIKLAAAVMMS